MWGTRALQWNNQHSIDGKLTTANYVLSPKIRSYRKQKISGGEDMDFNWETSLRVCQNSGAARGENSERKWSRI